MRTSSAVELIAEAIKRTAPDLSETEHRRFAVAIAQHGLLQKASALAGRATNASRGKNDLMKLRNQINRAQKTLDELGPEATLALFRAQTDSGRIWGDLSNAERALSRAMDRLPKLELSYEPVTNRPREDWIRKTTAYVARVFTELTGDDPRRLHGRHSATPPSGGFDSLLTAVFTALEIEASSDYQIRLLREGQKK